MYLGDIVTKELYAEYLQSGVWKKFRRKAMRRSGGFCELCGESAHCVHHWAYPKDLEYDNTRFHVALCNSCHDIIHAWVGVLSWNTNNYKLRRITPERREALAAYRRALQDWQCEQWEVANG